MALPASDTDGARAGLDPRAAMRGLVGGVLAGLGRFYARFAVPIGVALLVGLVAAVMALGWLRPVHAWDQIAYLGAAWRDSFADPAALHAQVWETVRQGTTPESFAVLAEGDAYRLRQSTDPLAFHSMLGMYAVKWLYVKTIGLVAPLTGAMKAAYAINIGAAALFLGAMLVWLRAVSMVNLAPAVAAFMLVAGFPALAMGETPDLLASALMLTAMLAYDRGRTAVGVVFMALAVLARPDQAASAGVLMAFLWMMGDRQTFGAAVGFAVAVGAYVVATHGSGHPGWWPHLWFSTYQMQETMEFFAPAISLVVYAKAFAWNLTRAATENAWLGLSVGLLFLWAVLHAGGLKFADRRTALIGAAFTAIAVKFVLFPLHDGRTTFPLLFPAFLLMLASVRDTARRGAAQDALPK